MFCCLFQSSDLGYQDCLGKLGDRVSLFGCMWKGHKYLIYNLAFTVTPPSENLQLPIWLGMSLRNRWRCRRDAFILLLQVYSGKYIIGTFNISFVRPTVLAENVARKILKSWI